MTEENSQEENLLLLWLTVAAFTAAMVAIFIYVPTEKTEGVVQRIMYFHIPSAWLAFFAFFVVFLSSILSYGRRSVNGTFMLRLPRKWVSCFAPWF